MRDDEANIAFSKAVNKLIREPGSRTKLLRVWDQIDNLDHADLDELAWELDVTWYDSTAPLHVKRELIRNADKVHARMGTKWAVRQVVQDYMGSCELEEWFEYGGDPYCFRIKITDSTGDEYDLDALNKLKNNVLRVKNTRSHIDEFSFKAVADIQSRRHHGNALSFSPRFVFGGTS